MTEGEVTFELGDDLTPKDDWPDTRKGLTHSVVITDAHMGGSYHLYILTGCYPDGRLGEIFLRLGKEGSTLRGLLNVMGILVTTLLRNGVTVSQICGLLREGGIFPPSGITDNKDMPEAESLTGYIADWLEENFD